MRSKSKINLLLLAFLFAGIVVLILFFDKTNTLPQSNDSAKVTADSVFYTTIYSELINFENIDLGITASDKAFSGSRSTKVSSEIEYGFGIHKKVAEFAQLKNAVRIDVELMAFSASPDSTLVCVFSVNDAQNPNLFWDSRPIKITKANEWQKVNFSFEIQANLKQNGNEFHVYFWNREKKEVFIDDFKFELFGSVVVKPESSENFNTNYFYDFETTDELSGAENIKNNSIVHSGNQVCDLSEGQEYGVSVSKKIKDVFNGGLLKISTSVWFYPLEDKPNTVLTVTVSNEKNELIFWGGESTEISPFEKGKWTKLNASFVLPAEKISGNENVVVNIWNKGKSKILADDLEIVYGEQKERKGILPLTNPNVYYEGNFIAERNKPPFLPFYLANTTINTDRILNVFSANDNFYAGNFIGAINSADELLCVSDKSIAMYSYDKNKNMFDVVFNRILSNDDKQIFNSEYKYFAADFTADGKTDLLMINKISGAISFCNYNNEKFLITPTSYLLSKKYLDAVDKMSVTNCFTVENTPSLTYINDEKIYLCNFKNNKLNYNETAIPLPDKTVFHDNDILLTPLGGGGSEKQLFTYNTDWRFDLKRVKVDGNNFVITHTVDFKGYKNDYNPKYYEFTKIICGNFTDRVTPLLLVVSCNCKDDDFDGKHCTHIQNISDLPNAVTVYELNK